MQVARNHADCVVIAHISDLHFKLEHSNYEKSEQAPASRHLVELRNRLIEAKPDFLAVTGDLADDPSEKIFQAACRYIKHLSDKVGIADACIAVIPGNHDLVRTGALPSFLVTKRARLDWFDEIFAAWLGNRTIEFTKADARSLTLKLACLNSNSDSWDINLAGGLVTERRLNAFRDEMGEIESREPFGVRVALVHHHLLPIAEAQLAGDNFREKEQFHLLNNAGVVMRDMVWCGVDLVLHGHRHRTSFSKIVYPGYVEQFANRSTNRVRDLLGEAGYRVISVIGAGSCGKTETATGSYRFNLIYLHLDGRIHAEEYENPQQTYPAQPSRTIYLIDSAAARATRYRWALESMSGIDLPSARAQSIKYSVVIDESGDGYARRDIRGFSALEGEVASIAFDVFSDWGYLSDAHQPTVVRKSSDAIDIKWKKKNSGRALPLQGQGQTNLVTYEGELAFAPSLTAQDSINLAVKYVVPNAFRMHCGVQSTRSNEAMGFIVGTTLTDQLMVSLDLPKTYALLIKEMRPVAIAKDKEDTIESKGLMLHACDGEYSFTVEQPLPGYRYGLTWELPTLLDYEMSRYGELKETERKIANFYVKTLLNNGQARAAVKDLLEILRGELCAFLDLGCRKVRQALGHAGAFVLAPSSLDLSFQIIDPATNHLKLVASTRQCVPGVWEMEYGRGIAGLALRRSQAVFHDNDTAGKGPHYYPHDGVNPHNWLCSIPIALSSTAATDEIPHTPIRWPIGVFNVGSLSFAPAIAMLFSNDLIPKTRKPACVGLQTALVDWMYQSEGFVTKLGKVLEGMSATQRDSGRS